MFDYNKSCIIMISCISYVAIAVSFTKFKIAAATYVLNLPNVYISNVTI